MSEQCTDKIKDPENDTGPEVPLTKLFKDKLAGNKPKKGKKRGKGKKKKKKG